MAMVSITPVSSGGRSILYQAVAGDKQSQGNTPGEALDALAAQLSDDESGTLIIVQNLRPDRFFTAVQQQRLKDLMDRWRTARDQGDSLSPDEQAELKALTDVELLASGNRAAALADELGR